MQETEETQVLSIGWEDPLEPSRDSSPLQYSCLENPMNRRAWRATVHKVAQNQTRLKQLNTEALMAQKDQETAFLSSSIGKPLEKVDQLEKSLNLALIVLE